MDAEVLRLREGLTLNKSLTAFAATLRTLAAEGSAEYVNYGQSALTKLLSDALGGNSLAAVITTLRQVRRLFGCYSPPCGRCIITPLGGCFYCVQLP